jgi:hypothetical protein
MNIFFSMLVHPYPRYGLAAALVLKNCTPAEFIRLDDVLVSQVLAEALEYGLGYFRMMTMDTPQLVQTLEYRPIAYDDLKQDATLVQSSGLAAKGKFLYPSVVTIDGNAKGTFENAVAMIKDLRANKPLLSRYDFSRSFAPTTAKINQNGKASLSEPPGTLFESACSAIATITHIKPAAWIGQKNSAIYPDLPLNEDNDALWQFILLFEEMFTSETSHLMQCTLPKKPATIDSSAGARAKVKTTAPKSEYKRPNLYRGNYPFAPRDAEAFGPAGLLGAIGRWAHSKGQVERGRRVLASLKNCPLYVVNYEAITQAQFDHHVIKLAQENQLSEIVHALTFDTRLYTEIEDDRPIWDAPARKLFAIFAGRFLQTFDAPAFRDFLSTRAEYSPALNPMFNEFFVSQLQEVFMSQTVAAEIVNAARELGRWINRSAYYAAKKEVEDEGKNDSPDQRERKIRQQKAKILVALDSIAMGAREPTAMMGSIMRETGMLTQTDAPTEALPFIDAVNIGDPLNMATARQLLMTYMRVRYAPSTPGKPIEGKPDENSTPDDQEDIPEYQSEV